ncbi:TetR/AcrR family transcriptional regulator [Pseudoxanthomonas putridarboris]|uniref:TetR/AcrR family transcriptional regulator n=1 Tax=Pseudoxanthomonas putridarboris TaxID=752605 RepID=A0ABU9J1J3_9GAMM
MSYSAGERIELQRQRILKAAKRCFIAHGFHAAAISDIAAEAGISQGLIYRYFENKRAIILAIIEMQLVENRENLDRLQASTDFVAALGQAYGLWAKGDPELWHAGLHGEIAAESLRDPIVADALRRSEQQNRQALMAWFHRRDAEMGRRTSDEDAQLRAALMSCIVEGLAIRAVREPDLPPEILRAMLERMMPLVLGD